MTVQAPVPVHAPPQPVKAEPEAGVAARLITDPAGKLAEHVAPQLTPAGELLIAPVPVPAFEVVRLYVGINVAVSDVSAVSVRLQFPVPVQAAPLQPAKADPAAATGVRTTALP